MEIRFTTQNFTGPLELLLVLVQKKEVELLDISLCPLFEQFVDQFTKEPSMEQAADFVSDFSHLIYLKSFALLPQQEILQEETEEFASGHFLDCLMAYCSIKEAAKTLSQQSEDQEYYYPRAPSVAEHAPVVTYNISLQDFSQAFAAVLRRAKNSRNAILDEEWSVAEKITLLRERLKGAQVTFEELFTPLQCREDLITTFLAVLELIKHQELFLVQKEGTFLLHG